MQLIVLPNQNSGNLCKLDIWRGKEGVSKDSHLS